MLLVVLLILPSFAQLANLYVVDPSVNFTFQWTADLSAQTLFIKLSLQSSGWVGFGISPNGGMIGADVFIGWVTSSGATTLNDRLAYGKSEPELDTSHGGTEDWIVTVGEESNSHTTIEAHRAFVTSDLQDYNFVGGTQRFVFAWCPTDPETDGTLLYHSGGRFPATLTLWGSPSSGVDNSTFPSDTTTTSLQFSNFTVPNAQTNYYCQGFTLQSESPHHLIAFNPIITHSSLVHHMILYGCDTPAPTHVYECKSMTSGCSEVMWAWAVGGQPFVLPNITGFRIGSPATYLSLQIHYDNNKGIQGAVDTSGVVIYHTPTLRQYDAGFVKLGHPSHGLTIPPGQNAYELGGVCDGSATNRLPTSVNVFASGMHMHLRGRRIWTDVIRGGETIGQAGSNQFYDFNFQQLLSISPPLVLQPGDEMWTHCVYNTSTDTTNIRGGSGTDDEMCYNYLAYYPKLSDVASCFSQTFPTQTASKPAKGKMKLLVIIVVVLVAFGTVGLGVYLCRRWLKNRPQSQRGGQSEGGARGFSEVPSSDAYELE